MEDEVGGRASTASSLPGDEMNSAPRTESASLRGDGEIDTHAVSAATDAVREIADLLPPDRVLALAICEPGGAPTDLVVHGRDGRLAVVAGLPEDRRPDLAALLALADGGFTASPSHPGQSSLGYADAREDVFRTIVEESPLPLMLLDGDHAIMYASPTVAYDLGWSRAELVGHHVLDFLHPDDRQRAARMMGGVSGTQRSGTVMTLRWRRRRRGYVAVEAAVRPVIGHAGDGVDGAVLAVRANPLQWTGVGEVLLAKERQRAMADGTVCGMAIVSANEPTLGAVLEANVPLARLAGTTRGQLAGTSLSSLVDKGDAERLQAALREVASEGGSTTLEITVVPRLGRQRLVTLTVTSSPLTDQSGRELIVRLQDTTEQAELMEELSRTVDHMERSNEELACLARITAHDLAAPLRAVSGLIDLLPHDETEADNRLTIEAIRSAIDRMQNMVAGVTGYVQSRSEQPTRTLVDLGELVEYVRETLDTEISERGAAIMVEETPTVYGDEHQLERVFLNLISNALKYSGDHPPVIRVFADRTANAWRISVSDQGIGVDDDQGDRIFELFSRVGPESGSGIGLTTCRRIVEQHGGRIWVDPNEPSGSVFRFTLPHEPTIAGG